MTEKKLPTLEILLVEDEKFHQTMAKKYLDKVNTPYHLHIAQDGEEALDYLNRSGNQENAPRPDLVLLDLGLPKMSGEEVFRQIKKNPDLTQTPVIVLTGADPDLVRENYPDIPANCRFTKWMEMKEFTSLVKTVQDFKIRFSKDTA